jgi:hypothetical protein
VLTRRAGVEACRQLGEHAHYGEVTSQFVSILERPVHGVVEPAGLRQCAEEADRGVDEALDISGVAGERGGLDMTPPMTRQRSRPPPLIAFTKRTGRMSSSRRSVTMSRRYSGCIFWGRDS